MGQEEVINFLKKREKEEFTTKEIAELIDISLRPVKRIMSKLLNDPFEEINKRELTFEEKMERYGTRVNSKIFVYWITK